MYIYLQYTVGSSQPSKINNFFYTLVVNFSCCVSKCSKSKLKPSSSRTTVFWILNLFFQMEKLRCTAKIPLSNVGKWCYPQNNFLNYLYMYIFSLNYAKKIVIWHYFKNTLPYRTINTFKARRIPYRQIEYKFYTYIRTSRANFWVAQGDRPCLSFLKITVRILHSSNSNNWQCNPLYINWPYIDTERR